MRKGAAAPAFRCDTRTVRAPSFAAFSRRVGASQIDWWATSPALVQRQSLLKVDTGKMRGAPFKPSFGLSGELRQLHTVFPRLGCPRDKSELLQVSSLSPGIPPSRQSTTAGIRSQVSGLRKGQTWGRVSWLVIGGYPLPPPPLFLQSINSKLVSKSTFAKYSFAMAYRQSPERMRLNAEIRGFRSQSIQK